MSLKNVYYWTKKKFFHKGKDYIYINLFLNITTLTKGKDFQIKRF